ncbi:M56 family metallopeptidase [Pontibacter sp. HSC-36F09]|uniref:M56 family metallopeptidase n=1 Tax=Pontibacter sp. HSC-36F09 TaxID=2910966 RepID=UPI0020A063F9|nr:M56 family metallopeptidase [Pontibacter sp. HSC-36F09]MCP2042421.1 hypothetical protein [Pontibacter sp. HSC-36F09]
MPALLLYLLKANVALVLFYLAYHLVLRKLTFYHLNRLFLVFGILFSAVYPLIDLSELFSRHAELAVVQSYAVVIPAWTPAPIPEQTAFDYWLIPVALFWLGCGLMLLRLAMQFASLYRIHRASIPATYQGVDFRKVPGISEAFSFWKTIYLNPAQHQSPELESILRHEQIHVNGWHTLDVLLAELSTVFYWFNPGVWLMKQAMKENLEFIADQHVVNAGVDRVAYQYLLLKVVGATQPQIANQFNFPSLKRRIAMMNKMPTNKANRLRLLVVLPLVTVLLVAFRSASQDDISTLTEAILPEEATTQAPTEPKNEYAAFYARNPEVSRISWGSNGKIEVALKSGAEEVYTFGDKQSMASAELKYGEMPSAPPVARRDSPGQDTNSPNIEKLINQLKQNQALKSVRSKKVDGKDAILIALKGGGTEVYFVADARSMAELERKYVLPELPPPPPPAPDAPNAPDAPPAPPAPDKAELIASMPEAALYYIDGVKASREAAQKLDPKTIHSMNIVKGKTAVEVFGKGASKGVISVVTEKNKDSRQVQEFNKKMELLVPPPPAPGTPLPPAPGKEAIPPVPPVPSREQLPPPPPPTRYEGPAIPKAGESRVVETEEHVAYFIWPENVTPQEVKTAKIAFNNNGMALNFIEEYDGDKLESLQITVKSPKGAMANAVYDAEALKGIVDAKNIIVVESNKKTGEVRIATLLR